GHARVQPFRYPPQAFRLVFQPVLRGHGDRSLSRAAIIAVGTPQRHRPRWLGGRVGTDTPFLLTTSLYNNDIRNGGLSPVRARQIRRRWLQYQIGLHGNATLLRGWASSK